MKASKFWITATAAVATAGTIGLAIAQQVNPQQPAPDAQVNTGSQSSSPQQYNPATGTANGMTNPGSGANPGSTSTTGAISGSSDAASTTTAAKADRN